MIKKASGIILGFILLSTVVFAQSGSDSLLISEQNEPEISQQIGLIYSTLGGSGIYYLFPGDKNRFRITGIFIYNKDKGQQGAGDSFFSIGAEYQRNLLEDKEKRAYVAVGTSLENTTFFSYADQSSSLFNLGSALGLDFGATKSGLILNLHLSYQLSVGTDETRIGLGGGLGVGFNFD